jgi:hypothetical protein
MRRTTLLLALLLGCSDDDAGAPDAAPVDAGPPGALSVWTEHIANKVQPTTAPGAGTGLTLATARRSTAAGQIVVRGAGGHVDGVNLSASALGDGAGHTIPASSVTLYRAAFIDMTGVVENEPGSQPVPASSPTGDPRIPDPLIPLVDPYTGAAAGAPFDVPGGENRPIWVDLWVPEDAAAGVYTGTITVSAAGQTAIEVPVSLTVWDLVLPDAGEVTTYFRSHLAETIRYHRDTYDCSGTSCWLSYGEHARTIVGRYEALGHEHRIDLGPEFVPEPESPSACAPPSDWSAYDAAMAGYLDGSAFTDGVPVSWVPTPFSPGVDWGYEADCTAAEYTALGAAWAAHLRELGALDRAVAYSYDEPPAEAFPAIAEDSANLQAGDAAWRARVLLTSEPEASNIDVLGPAIGIFTVCLRCYDTWSDPSATAYGRDEWPALRAGGTQLWFYESNAQSDPYPTFATNTLLGAEPLVALWGSWYEGATGFLLWDTVAWTEGDPWGQNDGWGKSGDGVLIYPGHHDGLEAPAGSPADVAIDGPIPSYRLKMVRTGLQDWALFRLAEATGVGAEARAAVATVYGQMGGCTWDSCELPENGAFFWRADAELIDAARAEVAAAILAAP